MSLATAPSRGASRDRTLVTGALVGATLLAWLSLLLRFGRPDRDSMEGMGMHAWSPADYVLTWAMWVVMMAAMMLPSIIPLTQVYTAIAVKARRQNSPVPATGVFVLGYLLVWAAFSLLATTAQLFLDRAALLTGAAGTTSLVLAGGLLLATGAYELTPLKRSCLRACRGPVDFVARHWRKGRRGAVRLGVDAGMWCLGCCAMLMALLFVGGVMNLVWVAAIAVLVLVEKLVPHGEVVSRVSGLVLGVAGLGLLVVAAV